MYYNEIERTIIKNLLKAESVNSRQEYVMHLNNGDIVKAKVDTCFDTDNGLDIDEEGYEEYYACAIEILEILEDNTGTLKVGMLMEINYHNWPKKIIDEKGTIV